MQAVTPRLVQLLQAGFLPSHCCAGQQRLVSEGTVPGRQTFVFRLLQSWQATLANGARFRVEPNDRDGLAVESPEGLPS